MEKPPTIRPEAVEQEKREVSPEKRTKMWETLRIAALSGLLAFGSSRASVEIYKMIDEVKQPGVSEVMPERSEGRAEERGESTGRDSMTISKTHEKLPRIEGDKIIKEMTLIMKDGKTYETKAEIDIETSQFAGEDPGTIETKIRNLKPNELDQASWNRYFISRVAEDGSGLHINYETTEDGLQMTIQELGPGGHVLSQRTSLTQEKTGN